MLTGQSLGLFLHNNSCAIATARLEITWSTSAVAATVAVILTSSKRRRMTKVHPRKGRRRRRVAYYPLTLWSNKKKRYAFCCCQGSDRRRSFLLRSSWQIWLLLLLDLSHPTACSTTYRPRFRLLVHILFELLLLSCCCFVWYLFPSLRSPLPPAPARVLSDWTGGGKREDGMVPGRRLDSTEWLFIMQIGLCVCAFVTRSCALVSHPFLSLGGVFSCFCHYLLSCAHTHTHNTHIKGGRLKPFQASFAFQFRRVGLLTIVALLHHH